MKQECLRLYGDVRRVLVLDVLDCNVTVKMEIDTNSTSISEVVISISNRFICLYNLIAHATNYFQS
jgi:hypothetical protein